jgi:two-component system response regulator DegU
MTRKQSQKTKRVLIASNHTLFGEGLRSLLQQREEADVEVIGVVSNVEDALHALPEHRPDLIIVDYDDELLNREDILTRFLETEQQLRVVLLSIHDGGREALVYDRRTMEASQVGDWLD